MYSISVILKTVFIAFLVLAITIVVYFLIYKRNVNKALENRDGSKRRMPAPHKVLISVSGAIAFVLIIYISRSMIHTDSGIDQAYFNAYYNFDVYEPEEMTGYLSMYSMEKNAGYKKYIEEKGDVKVTYFLSEEKYDTYHPTFIAFVEYAGEKEVLYKGYHGQFLTHAGESICGKGAAGSDVTEYFVVMGDASIGCTFELEIYYYDTEEKGEEMSDVAVSSEKISIELN